MGSADMELGDEARNQVWHAIGAGINKLEALLAITLDGSKLSDHARAYFEMREAEYIVAIKELKEFRKSFDHRIKKIT